MEIQVRMMPTEEEDAANQDPEKTVEEAEVQAKLSMEEQEIQRVLKEEEAKRILAVKDSSGGFAV
jgi:hypothetical protein